MGVIWLRVGLIVGALACARPALAGPAPFAAAPAPPVPFAPNVPATGTQPSQPQAVLVPLAPPPQPFGPATTAIGTAYSAIQRAAVVNPAAAQRAEYAYALALSRMHMGDRASAAAYAASAMAIANAGIAASEATKIAPIDARTLTGGVAAASAATTAKRYGAFGDVSLPDYLIAARDRIATSRAQGADVTASTHHLRAAVDAWLAGDAARARGEAHAATAALPASK
jgi:hypothetical protein